MLAYKRIYRVWVIIAWLLFWPGIALSQSFTDVLEMDVVVHFIDVGIGDAIFIELPDKQHEVIIDGGDIRRGFNFIDYIRDDVDNPIELAVITHPDYDHWSGIERLCKTFKVNQLWDPGYDRDCKFKGAKGEDKKKRDTYLKFINKSSQLVTTLIRPVKADLVDPAFEMDGVKFWILHADDSPDGPDCAYKINNASIVIKMQYKDTTFLFTGDGNGLDRKEAGSGDPKYVEAHLLSLEKINPGILKAEVLKVSNHGSTTANTTAFIRAVSPRVAVISSSVTNHYKLPKKRVLQRLKRIYFNRTKKIEKVLRTNYGEKSYETRRFGDDHIICGTNGDPDDLICDYIWNFEE